MKVLDFSILDRKYQISCPDNEEEILKACVALVDSRMKTLKSQGKLHSTEKIAIMVALTLAKDFLMVGGANKQDNLEKISEISTKIEKALAPQDDLFWMFLKCSRFETKINNIPNATKGADNNWPIDKLNDRNPRKLSGSRKNSIRKRTVP